MINAKAVNKATVYHLVVMVAFVSIISKQFALSLYMGIDCIQSIFFYQVRVSHCIIHNRTTRTMTLLWNGPY